MSMFVRSGRPQHINAAATSAGTIDEWIVTVGPTSFFKIHNTHATETLRVYLTSDAQSKDEGIDIPAGFGMELPVEIIRFWTLTSGAGSFQALVCGRP